MFMDVEKRIIVKEEEQIDKKTKEQKLKEGPDRGASKEKEKLRMTPLPSQT